MVSESVLSFLKDEQRTAFKDHEYKKYKQLHGQVITDEGIPSLKKRGYAMPGYRRVLDDSERKTLEKVLTKQQENNVFEYALNTYILKKKDNFVPKEAEGLDNDIVPVDLSEHSRKLTSELRNESKMSNKTKRSSRLNRTGTIQEPIGRQGTNMFMSDNYQKPDKDLERAKLASDVDMNMLRK